MANTQTYKRSVAQEDAFVALHRSHMELLKGIYEERIAIRDRRIADLELRLAQARHIDVLPTQSAGHPPCSAEGPECGSAGRLEV